ncbi:hypothetical protein B0H14DRAFT_2978159 [Mycena olivaceomarginata]|nr:hypothetical protein B0H14DRAFT_2978159 [Mycena olivaceomarginata]
MQRILRAFKSSKSSTSTSSYHAAEMSATLKGKIAVITGSSRSIGAAIAKHFGKQGAKVVVNYVNDAQAADGVVSSIKAAGGSAAAVKADASTIAGGQHLLDEAVKAFGGIDIIVLNAGIMGSKLLADPAGRIIFFSTSLTVATGVAPNTLVYTATKGAVEQLARILAKDPSLGAKGITVNTVSPGPVDTPLFRAGKPQGVIDAIAKAAPSGRLGEVGDVAPVVGFLASPAAQWVNGQNVRVNGGFA